MERSKRRQRLIKALAGLTPAWVVVEVLVLPVLPRHLSFRWRSKLPAPLRIIGQRSIHDYPLRDYVLMLGDSYAEGWGDWHLSVDRDGDPAYNACHLVAEHTGRDVVNFGRSGASTVSSTAFLVNKRFAALGRTRLGDPAAVVIQFYEGNDLDGSLADYIRHTGAPSRSGRSASPAPRPST